MWTQWDSSNRRGIILEQSLSIFRMGIAGDWVDNRITESAWGNLSTWKVWQSSESGAKWSVRQLIYTKSQGKKYLI